MIMAHIVLARSAGQCHLQGENASLGGLKFFKMVQNKVTKTAVSL
jgi:hypothetical protein